MKLKLTSLMFGLLLAVGWTGNVFAQSAVLKAEDMAGWTYKWLPENATDSVTANYVVWNAEKEAYEAPVVTNAYQIYDLLRHIYMDKRLPGPTYSAYTANGNREGKVYYGGARNGWNIPGNVSSGITSNIGQLRINLSRGGTYNSNYKRVCCFWI